MPQSTASLDALPRAKARGIRRLRSPLLKTGKQPQAARTNLPGIPVLDAARPLNQYSSHVQPHSSPKWHQPPLRCSFSTPRAMSRCYVETLLSSRRELSQQRYDKCSYYHLELSRRRLGFLPISEKNTCSVSLYDIDSRVIMHQAGSPHCGAVVWCEAMLSRVSLI